MPLHIKRTPFLSQLEDMEAYISQYEEVKEKQEQLQQETSIIDKNVTHNTQQNQYMYSQQNSNDYVNNFLVPPTLNGHMDAFKSYPPNNQSFTYNTQNMFYQQPPMDSNRNLFMNIGYNGVYNNQTLYNDFYKNYDQNMNVVQGGMTNNSAASTIAQSTSPLGLNYGNMPYQTQFMNKDNGENGYYMNNNAQFYQSGYHKGNQLWKPDGSSSVWS